MKPSRLPIWTSCHVICLFAIAYVLGILFSNFVAYWGTLIIYWTTCWITLYVFRNLEQTQPQRQPKRHIILDYLPFLPLVGVALTAVSTLDQPPPFVATILIIVAAVLNGITEEFYWRRLFCNAFYPNVTLGFAVPLLLFSIWHIALLLIPAITYQGGPLALVGGGAVLGLVWAIAYWFNQKIWTIASAHVLVNAFAFMMLAHDNTWLPG